MNLTTIMDKVLKTGLGAILLGLLACVCMLVIVAAAKYGMWVLVAPVVCLPCYVLGDFIVEDWQ